MAKNKSLEKPVKIEKKVAQPKIEVTQPEEESTESESASEEEEEIVISKKKVKSQNKTSEVIVEEEKPKPKRQLSEKQKAAFEKARKVLAENNAIRKAEKEKEKLKYDTYKDELIKKKENKKIKNKCKN